MRRWIAAVAALTAVAAVSAGTAGAATSATTIDRRADLLAGLAVELRLTVACSAPEVTGPISLSVQLQQLQLDRKDDQPIVVNGSAFSQGVVCDGTEREYVAVVRTFAPIGQPLPLFRKGLALATASLLSCGTQFCTIVGQQAAGEVRIR